MSLDWPCPISAILNVTCGGYSGYTYFLVSKQRQPQRYQRRWDVALRICSERKRRTEQYDPYSLLLETRNAHRCHNITCGTGRYSAQNRANIPKTFRKYDLGVYRVQQEILKTYSWDYFVFTIFAYLSFFLFFEYLAWRGVSPGVFF